MLTSGMGFFTDAYDLFIIGVVLAILTPLWDLSKLDVSLIGSTSLIAAALGAVPALATFYLRRQIAETPRFALAMQGDVDGAMRTVHAVTGSQKQKAVVGTQKPATKSSQQPRKSWLYLLLQRRYLKWLIGTAGAWFLLDIAYYGTV